MSINEALYCIPSDISRDEWVKVAQALKSNGETFETFDTWSSSAANYKSSDCMAVWKSISSHGGIGIGTLFHIAKQYGFKPSKIDQGIVEIAKTKSRQIYLQGAKDKAMRQQQVAIQAEAILAESRNAVCHPYLIKKRISAPAIWVTPKNYFVVPVLDLAANIRSLQFISPNGEKQFLKGGAIKGNFYQLSSGTSNEIVICEGYATGVTLCTHYAPHASIVVAFNAGNLLAVAEVFRSAYPDAEITIAGDCDVSGNGQRLATLAAEAVRGKVSIPYFIDNETGTDFNDRWCLDNPEVVYE
jgi:putative DNA primase/helicase